MGRGYQGGEREDRMSAAVPPRTVALLLSACTILVQGPGTAVVTTILHRRRPRSPANPDDGFRVIARKNGDRVRLYSRPGNDLTYRFRLIVEAPAKLRSRSCTIDGEAVACSEDGIRRQTA
jgi:ATP dependent DNA ligase domain